MTDSVLNRQINLATQQIQNVLQQVNQLPLNVDANATALKQSAQLMFQTVTSTMRGMQEEVSHCFQQQKQKEIEYTSIIFNLEARSRSLGQEFQKLTRSAQQQPLKKVQDELNAAKTELTESKNRIQELTQEILGKEEQKNNAREELQTANQELREANQNLATARQELMEANIRLQTSEANGLQLRQNMEHVERELRQMQGETQELRTRANNEVAQLNQELTNARFNLQRAENDLEQLREYAGQNEGRLIQELRDARQDNVQLNVELQRARDDLGLLRPENPRLASKLQRTRDKAGLLRQENVRLLAELEGARDDLGLLRIDNFRLTAELERAQDDLGLLRTELQQDRARLDQQLANYRLFVTQRAQLFMQQYNQLRNELQDCHRQLSQASNTDTGSNLRDNVAILQTRLEHFQDLNAQLQSNLLQVQQRAAQLERQNDSQVQRLQDTTSRAAAVEAQLIDRTQQVARLEALVTETRQALQESGTKAAVLEAQLELRNQQVARLESEVQQLKQSLAENTACEERVRMLRQDLETIQREGQELRSRYNASVQELQERTLAATQCEAKLKAMAQNTREYGLTRQELIVAQANVREKEVEARELRRELSTLQNQVAINVATQEQMVRLVAEKDRLKQQVTFFQEATKTLQQLANQKTDQLASSLQRQEEANFSLQTQLQEALRALESHQHECQVRLQEKERINREAGDRLAQVQTELQTCRQEYNSFRASSTQNIADLNQRLTLVTHSMEALQSEIRIAEAGKQSAEQRAKQVSEELSAQQNTLVTLNQEQARLLNELGESQSRGNVAANTLRLQLEACERTTNQLSTQLSNITRAAQESEERIAQLNQQQRELQEEKDTLLAAKEQVQAEYQAARQTHESTLSNLKQMFQEKSAQVQREAAANQEEALTQIQALETRYLTKWGDFMSQLFEKDQQVQKLKTALLQEREQHENERLQVQQIVSNALSGSQVEEDAGEAAAQNLYIQALEENVNVMVQKHKRCVRREAELKARIESMTQEQMTETLREREQLQAKRVKLEQDLEQQRATISALKMSQQQVEQERNAAQSKFRECENLVTSLRIQLYKKDADLETYLLKETDMNEDLVALRSKLENANNQIRALKTEHSLEMTKLTIEKNVAQQRLEEEMSRVVSEKEEFLKEQAARFRNMEERAEESERAYRECIAREVEIGAELEDQKIVAMQKDYDYATQREEQMSRQKTLQEQRNALAADREALALVHSEQKRLLDMSQQELQRAEEERDAAQNSLELLNTTATIDSDAEREYLQDILRQVESLKEKLAACEQREANYGGELQGLASASVEVKQRLENERRSLVLEKQDLKERLEFLNRQLESSQQELQRAQLQRDSSKQIARLSRSSSKRAKAGQLSLISEISRLHDEILKQGKRVSQLEAELSESKIELAIAKTALSQKKTNSQMLMDAVNEADRARQEATALSTEIQETNLQLDRLRQELQSCTNREHKSKLETITAVNETKVETAAEIQRLEGRLAEYVRRLETTQSNNKNLQQQLLELSQEKDRLEREVQEKGQMVEEKQLLLDMNIQKYELQNQVQSKKDRLEQDIQFLRSDVEELQRERDAAKASFAECEERFRALQLQMSVKLRGLSEIHVNPEELVGAIDSATIDMEEEFSGLRQRESEKHRLESKAQELQRTVIALEQQHQLTLSTLSKVLLDKTVLRNENRQLSRENVQLKGNVIAAQRENVEVQQEKELLSALKLRTENELAGVQAEIERQAQSVRAHLEEKQLLHLENSQLRSEMEALEDRNREHENNIILLNQELTDLRETIVHDEERRDKNFQDSAKKLDKLVRQLNEKKDSLLWYKIELENSQEKEQSLQLELQQEKDKVTQLAERMENIQKNVQENVLYGEQMEQNIRNTIARVQEEKKSIELELVVKNKREAQLVLEVKDLQRVLGEKEQEVAKMQQQTNSQLHREIEELRSALQSKEEQLATVKEESNRLRSDFSLKEEAERQALQRMQELQSTLDEAEQARSRLERDLSLKREAEAQLLSQMQELRHERDLLTSELSLNQEAQRQALQDIAELRRVVATVEAEKTGLTNALAFQSREVEELRSVLQKERQVFAAAESEKKKLQKEQERKALLKPPPNEFQRALKEKEHEISIIQGEKNRLVKILEEQKRVQRDNQLKVTTFERLLGERVQENREQRETIDRLRTLHESTTKELMDQKDKNALLLNDIRLLMEGMKTQSSQQ